MRIAQVATAGTLSCSGILTALSGLSIALARRGHQVEVWQLSPWEPDETRELRRDLEGAGVGLVPLHVASNWHLGSRTARAIDSRRPDVVHLYSVFSPTNNALARRLHVPYIVSPQGGYAPEVLARHGTRKRIFRRFLELPMLKKAAKIFALSPVEEQELRNLGVSTSIAVVPNGVPPPPKDIDPTAFRRELGIGSQPLVLYVGRFDLYQKRIDTLVRGVASAPEWHLALVGTDYRGGGARLRALTASLGLNHRVHFRTPRYGRSLHECYSAADVFGLPSRFEGYPMALLEAMSHGTPAIVSSAVDERTHLEAAGAGWRADPARLGDTLRHLPTGRRASSAQRYAASNFAKSKNWMTISALIEENVAHLGRREQASSGSVSD